MNIKKIAAFAAAICVICGAVSWNTEYSAANISYAAENEDANKITLNKIGDKVPLSLGGTTDIPKWYSDDESVAVIASTGGQSAEVTATGKGSTAVYAILSGQTLRFDVTVLGIEDEPNKTVDVGTVTLTNARSEATADITGANAEDAVWNTSDPSVAVVDGKGVITAVNKGTCRITAVYENVTYVINVVSEYDPSVVPETPASLLCELEFSNQNPTRSLKFEVPSDEIKNWRSTDESVVTVSESGVMKAVGSGNCRVYVEVQGNLCYIEVKSTYDPNQSTVIELGEITLTAEKKSQKLTLNNVAENAKIEWSSSDSSIAAVSDSGLIIGVSSGSCRVIAKVDGVEYGVNVNVDFKATDDIPTTVIRGIGSTATINITGMSGEIKFSTSDSSVAAVDKNGKITAVGEGTAVITAEFSGGTSVMYVKVVKSGIIGDANDDGKVEIADATLILQYLTNKDEYQLTEAGLYNADVDGIPGVTASDALAIQQLDAGIIHSLPLVTD